MFPERGLGRLADKFNIVAGIWLVISPFFFAFATTRLGAENNVAVGLAIVVFAAIHMGAVEAPWASGINVALGIWLIASPFVLGLQPGATTTHNLVLGACVAILALVSIFAGRPVPARRPGETFAAAEPTAEERRHRRP